MNHKIKETFKDLFILWNARNFPRTNFQKYLGIVRYTFVSIDNMYCLKTLLRIGDRREVTGLALEMGLTNYKTQPHLIDRANFEN